MGETGTTPGCRPCLSHSLSEGPRAVREGWDSSYSHHTPLPSSWGYPSFLSEDSGFTSAQEGLQEAVVIPSAHRAGSCQRYTHSWTALWDGSKQGWKAPGQEGKEASPKLAPTISPGRDRLPRVALIICGVIAVQIQPVAVLIGWGRFWSLSTLQGPEAGCGEGFLKPHREQ